MSNWPEKQKYLHNFIDHHNSEPYRYLDSLFLSEVMDDEELFRRMVHTEKKYAPKVVEALLSYAEHKDKNLLEEDLEQEINSVNTEKLMQTNWVKIDKYFKPVSKTVYDWMATSLNSNILKHYFEARPVDVLEDIAKEYRGIIKKVDKFNSTGHGELDLLLSNVRLSWNGLNMQVYTKALAELNKDIIDIYDHKKAITAGHADAILMMGQKSDEILELIDYPMQRGFHQTRLCEEMLKFSYLTTFDKKPISKRQMDKYISNVKNAGSWIVGAKIVNWHINKRSSEYRGINNSLLELGFIKQPEKKQRIYNQYFKRDVDNISRGGFYFKYRAQVR